MARCIQLAKNGLGTTYPNPLVGCVIVHDNHIIGEGWHDKAGNPHAEVNAILSVQDKNLLKESTLYVNLEPCSHFGKTPPCADLIIKKNLKKVVVGTQDPNKKVAGKGIERLQKAGIEVIQDILESECNELNKRFFTYHREKRPYVFLKWAETLNGFLAPKKRKKQAPVWISNEYSKQWVHQLRASEQAILVGTNTVLEDNPSLTTRDWEGPNPLRVVLDRSRKIPNTMKVLDQSTPTLVLTEHPQPSHKNLAYASLDFTNKMAANMLDILFEQGIQSLIVEGGLQTLETFINEGLWDEAFVFKGNQMFEEGIPAPFINGKLIDKHSFRGDMMYHFKNSPE